MHESGTLKKKKKKKKEKLIFKLKQIYKMFSAIKPNKY
jgi:hypothetical protein